MALRKDDMQIPEAFHVKNSNCSPLKTSRKEITAMQTNGYFWDLSYENNVHS